MGNRFELVASAPVDGWSPALFNGRPLFRPHPIDFHMPSFRCDWVSVLYCWWVLVDETKLEDAHQNNYCLHRHHVCLVHGTANVFKVFLLIFCQSLRHRLNPLDRATIKSYVMLLTDSILSFGYRRETVRVSSLQQSLQSIVQPDHAQPQTHRLQTVLLRPMRTSVPTQGRPETTHGDAASRRRSHSSDRRRCCSRRHEQSPVAMPYGRDHRLTG